VRQMLVDGLVVFVLLSVFIIRLNFVQQRQMKRLEDLIKYQEKTINLMKKREAENYLRLKKLENR